MNAAPGERFKYKAHGTAVYLAVHEDSEYRATPQSERAVGF